LDVNFQPDDDLVRLGHRVLRSLLPERRAIVADAATANRVRSGSGFRVPFRRRATHLGTHAEGAWQSEAKTCTLQFNWLATSTHRGVSPQESLTQSATERNTDTPIRGQLLSNSSPFGGVKNLFTHRAEALTGRHCGPPAAYRRSSR